MSMTAEQLDGFLVALFGYLNGCPGGNFVTDAESQTLLRLARQNLVPMTGALAAQGWSVSNSHSPATRALPENVVFDNLITDVKSLIADVSAKNWVKAVVDAGKILQDGGSLFTSVAGSFAGPLPDEFPVDAPAIEKLEFCCKHHDTHGMKAAGDASALPFGGLFLQLVLKAISDILAGLLTKPNPAPAPTPSGG